MQRNVSPVDIRQLEFYEIEYLLKEIEEHNEEEEKRNKAQEKEYEKNSKQMKMPNVGKTNYGGFPTPKIPSIKH
jgi:predicted nucleic acid-binding protein